MHCGLFSLRAKRCRSGSRGKTALYTLHMTKLTFMIVFEFEVVFQSIILYVHSIPVVLFNQLCQQYFFLGNFIFSIKLLSFQLFKVEFLHEALLLSTTFIGFVDIPLGKVSKDPKQLWKARGVATKHKSSARNSAMFVTLI